jgi:DNA-binding transcriptional LysR family regulator
MYGLSQTLAISTIAEGSAKMQNEPMFDWGDLRHFLAVARSGSTLAAAKLLCVNQTTVARRIATLEQALGERLFDRAAGGYRLTEVGAAMVQNAERVETEVEAFSRVIVQRSRKLSGVIRVTTNEVLADMLLTPWLGEFTERFSVVQVETIITERRLDLERGEADIAIRAAQTPISGDGLVARRLARGKWGVYCSRSYAAEHGMPQSPAQLVDHPIVAGMGMVADMEPDFMNRARAEGAVIRSASSSLVAVASAIRSGIGIGGLPCILGGLDPQLQRCFLYDESDYDLMLITREEIRGLPHVRAFNDFIASRTAVLRYIIEGRD